MDGEKNNIYQRQSVPRERIIWWKSYYRNCVCVCVCVCYICCYKNLRWCGTMSRYQKVYWFKKQWMWNHVKINKATRSQGSSFNFLLLEVVTLRSLLRLGFGNSVFSPFYVLLSTYTVTHTLLLKFMFLLSSSSSAESFNFLSLSLSLSLSSFVAKKCRFPTLNLKSQYEAQI